MFGGRTSSSASMGAQGFIQKCDKNGNVNWFKTYGGKGQDLLYVVHNTSDGGFIGAGTTNSYGPNELAISYPYLVKINNQGNQVWQKLFIEHNQTGNFYDVKETPDHGFVAAGFLNANPYDPLFILKTNANGDSLWSKEFTRLQAEEQGSSIALGPSGEIAIAGLVFLDSTPWINYPTFTYLSSGGGLILQRTYTQIGSMPWTNNGNTWGFRYGRPVNFEKIIAVPAGFIVVMSSDLQPLAIQPACRTCGIALSVTVFKIDFQGNLKWNKSFKGLGKGVVFNDVILKPDGGLLISGGATDSTGNSNCWLLNTDANGNKTSESYTPINGTSSWAAGAFQKSNGYAIGIESQPLLVNRVGFFGFLSTDINGKIIDESK